MPEITNEKIPAFFPFFAEKTMFMISAKIRKRIRYGLMNVISIEMKIAV